MPHYRLDKVGKACANGSVPVYATWMFGDSLSAVRNCPIHGTEYRRSVRITGEADTFFSQPAEVTLFGVKIKGFITMVDDGDHAAGYVFNYNRF